MHPLSPKSGQNGLLLTIARLYLMDSISATPALFASLVLDIQYLLDCIDQALTNAFHAGDRLI